VLSLLLARRLDPSFSSAPEDRSARRYVIKFARRLASSIRVSRLARILEYPIYTGARSRYPVSYF